MIITNAEDLNATDFACWISETDGVPTMLPFEYNATQKTLTISSETPLDLVSLRDIHFGQKFVDFNICEGDMDHYY